MRAFLLLILTLVLSSSIAQDKLTELLNSKQSYEEAFIELKGMLDGNIPLSFKRAVFVSENAYYNNKLDFNRFNDHIRLLSAKALLIASQSDLIYNESDKESVKKYAAVFRLMTDTIRFYGDSLKIYETRPFRYDFEDFWGEKDWRKMFVSKMLITNSGNCHSLPYLYKIICEEIGEKAYLSMAPNHTYIKLKCKKLGWYNTELTSGHFPIDAWIMASGYVHLTAVQNKIYMDTLSDKQSVAACLVDLAKGYEKKFGDYASLDFIIKSCDLALSYYPNYVNGMILKAETMKRRFEHLMKIYGAEYPSDLFETKETK